MSTGILEIDELTMRSFEQLPAIPTPIEGGHGVIVQFLVQLDNPMFDGMYQGIVMFGELGLYRVGALDHILIPKQTGEGRRLH